jgi:hypothetical protein
MPPRQCTCAGAGTCLRCRVKAHNDKTLDALMSSGPGLSIHSAEDF